MLWAVPDPAVFHSVEVQGVEEGVGERDRGREGLGGQGEEKRGIEIQGETHVVKNMRVGYDRDQKSSTLLTALPLNRHPHIHMLAPSIG